MTERTYSPLISGGILFHLLRRDGFTPQKYNKNHKRRRILLIKIDFSMKFLLKRSCASSGIRRDAGRRVSEYKGAETQRFSHAFFFSSARLFPKSSRIKL